MYLINCWNVLVLKSSLSYLREHMQRSHQGLTPKGRLTLVLCGSTIVCPCIHIHVHVHIIHIHRNFGSWNVTYVPQLKEYYWTINCIFHAVHLVSKLTHDTLLLFCVLSPVSPIFLFSPYHSSLLITLSLSSPAFQFSLLGPHQLFFLVFFLLLFFSETSCSCSPGRLLIPSLPCPVGWD